MTARAEARSVAGAEAFQPGHLTRRAPASRRHWVWWFTQNDYVQFTYMYLSYVAAAAAVWLLPKLLNIALLLHLLNMHIQLLQKLVLSWVLYNYMIVCMEGVIAAAVAYRFSSVELRVYKFAVNNAWTFGGWR